MAVYKYHSLEEAEKHLHELLPSDPLERLLKLETLLESLTPPKRIKRGIFKFKTIEEANLHRKKNEAWAGERDEVRYLIPDARLRNGERENRRRRRIGEATRERQANDYEWQLNDAKQMTNDNSWYWLTVWSLTFLNTLTPKHLNTFYFSTFKIRALIATITVLRDISTAPIAGLKIIP